ncbi:MAG: zinc-ribbon domain-containing protein [Chloroflexota bacterium]
MKIRHLLLLFAIVASLASSTYLQPVYAQADNEPAGFKNVTLWVNPEYDDPRLLVMLEGQIVGATAPVPVSFLVPAGAEMFSAGSMDAQGRYSGGPPDRTASSIPGWDEISYELQADTFRVEYYDPIIIGQPDKTISYDFRWRYPISDLKVVVQEPKASTNFMVSPEGTNSIDVEGFPVYLYDYANLGKDDPPLHFDIAYTKTDPNPSLDNPVLNSGNTTTGTGSSTTGLILGIVIGAIVAGGFVWILLSKNKPARAPVRAVKNGQTGTVKSRTRRRRFCSRCGQPIENPSQFCPHCGHKLSS